MVQWGVSIILGILARQFWIYAPTRTTPDQQNAFVILSAVLTLVAVVFFIVGLCFSFDERKDQLSDKEIIIAMDNIIAILKEKTDLLINDFKAQLLKYPEIEKGIFDKIKPNSTSMYFAEYPQLKSSKVLIHLVDLISKEQEIIYKKKIEKENKLAKMRFRPSNPWTIPFFIPKYNIDEEKK